MTQLAVRECLRTYSIEDLTVRSNGDGRTVEAYAAVFGVQAEINDQDGHYHEDIAPGAFTKTLQDKGTQFGVLFNHGMTVHGTPSGELSVPIGVPVEVRADERGVYTVTRYLDNPLADAILDAIKNRAITAQSFSGRFIKSTRGRAARGKLPTITRHEIALREYGPTAFPAYSEAAVIGTRAQHFVETLLSLPAEKRVDFLNNFEPVTLTEPTSSGTSTEAAEIDEPGNHSTRSVPLRTRIRAARIARGME